jgi:hypothetical protein
MAGNKRDFFFYIFKITLAAALSALLVINFFAHYLTYDELVNVILKSLRMQDKTTQFKASFFTPDKFIFLKGLLLLMTLFLFYLITRVKTEIIFSAGGNIYKGFAGIWSKIKELICGLSLVQKISLSLVFIVIVALRIFYWYKFPLFTDEAFSYVYFVSRGFLVSASYYPGPNNHVFYSELCTFTDLFFDDPLWIMRLPSFLISLALSFLLFVTVKKYHGFLIALFTLVVFSFSDNVNFYSIQGRGYILLTFFAFISALSLVKYLFGERKVYLFVFIVSSVLGFYTIPVFLYPFLSLALFTLIVLIKYKRLNRLVHFFFIFSGIGFLSGLFYLPVLLFNNINTITGNTWVLPSRSFLPELVPYIFKVNDYLWNINFGIYLTIVVLAGSLFFLVKSRKVNESLFGLLWLVLPLIAICIQKVIPFERIGLYMFVLLAFVLSYFLMQLLSVFVKNNSVRNGLALTLVFSSMSLMVISDYTTIVRKSFGYYKEMDAFIDKVYAASPSDIMVDDHDYNTFIKYRYLREGKPVNLESANIPAHKFDMIVSHSPLPQADSALYGFAFGNSCVKAYKAKK